MKTVHTFSYDVYSLIKESAFKNKSNKKSKKTY